MNRGPVFHDPKRALLPHFVYRCYDQDGTLLYIGSSGSPLLRVAAHEANAWWGDRIHRTRYTVFPNRDHALAVERAAIYAERPIANIRNRWYKRDKRKDWKLEDYSIFYQAVTNASTPGHLTAELLNGVRTEALNRFGVFLVATPAERLATP